MNFDETWLNRLGIILNFLAGFMLAPELIGIERLKKIELFLKNTKLAHDMGIRGRELVEKQFTIEKHIKNLLIATSEAVKHY